RMRRPVAQLRGVRIALLGAEDVEVAVAGAHRLILKISIPKSGTDHAFLSGKQPEERRRQQPHLAGQKKTWSVPDFRYSTWIPASLTSFKKASASERTYAVNSSGEALDTSSMPRS